jgi:uncharacterized protein YjaZ
MGIQPTDEWLEKDFNQPVLICERFLMEFNETDPKKIYTYLKSFGMYRPTDGSRRIFELLKEKNVWDMINNFYRKYRKKWKGPEVNIYIFPVSQPNRFLFRGETTNKSGVSFHNRIFLFLGDYKDEKEIEALFIHEYHHVCRIRKQGRDVSQFTLLDSIILEGLAELEVEKICGAEYLADWCHFYSDDDIEIFMKKYIQANLTLKKNVELHDVLLFGVGKYPKLLGYACGYYLVRNAYKENHFSTITSFAIPGKYFITNTEKV